MLSRFITLILLLSFFATAHSQSTREVYFATDPAVSPDGSIVVFSYESDLWKVSAEGGIAVRLTGMDGEETAPLVSPDGQWLAFSSNQYGNNDIYIMPLEGGEITRLTHHQAGDQVESWDWDSKSLFFRSDRYNRASVYRVEIGGGTPVRLFGHYHNTVHNLVKHPQSGDYYFNESWESFIFPQRKKYRGPFNPDIKSYNPETGAFARHTDWEGKDMWPLMDRNGTLYFVSDEANGEYNLYTLQNGQKRQLTTFDTSVRNPAVSADGSAIVFEREYQLYLYDVPGGSSRKIPISIYRNNTLAKEQSFNVENNIGAFDVAPDKKKMAFVSRGELFVSDVEGKFIRRLETDPMGRVLEVKWLPGSKSLIFNQTVEGYQNWFTIAADGSGQARQLTDDRQNNRMLALNSDRSMGVYLSGRNQLRVIDLDSESMGSRTIVTDEFWGFQNDQPRFAPDDNHIIYSARRDFEFDLFAYNLESGESTNLTHTGVTESNPFWSPDGKYLYFASSRVRPSYPRGSGETDLYRMALTEQEEPYRSDRFEQLFTEEEKDTADTEKPVITINEEGLMQRLEQIGPGFGSQFAPYVIQKKEETTVLYMSNHDEGSTSLWKTVLKPFESPKTTKFEGISFVNDIVEADGDLYALSRSRIYTLNVGTAKATQVEVEFDFKRNLRNEFDQMFDELWANIEENFYNETFHGTDWQAIRARYRTYLPYVNSRNDFSRMMNDMLGELNSSHMGFSTFGPEEDEFYETGTLSPGILFEEGRPYVVASIVKDGPADLAGKNIRPGDRLVAVDGREVDPSQNREMYFTRPEMEEELALTFERGGDRYSVKVHPDSYFSTRNDLYDEWVDHNQQVVDNAGGKRIAYVHMKNMGGGELQNFLEEMTSEAYKRDALILDLRYNTGGNVHNDVLQFLSQRPYLQWKYRNGDYAPQPNFTPAAKPIVLLINEQSLSDAEVTSAGFKELGLGTVMGEETYRWIIFTSGKGLVDGSFYRLPSWGVYNFEGENLERIGVEPDVRVENTFKDRLEGSDPQLQHAIKHIMEQLGNK